MHSGWAKRRNCFDSNCKSRIDFQTLTKVITRMQLSHASCKPTLDLSVSAGDGCEHVDHYSRKFPIYNFLIHYQAFRISRQEGFMALSLWFILFNLPWFVLRYIFEFSFLVQPKPLNIHSNRNRSIVTTEAGFESSIWSLLSRYEGWNHLLSSTKSST